MPPGLGAQDSTSWPGTATPVQAAAAMLAQHVISRLVAGHAFRIREHNLAEAHQPAPVSAAQVRDLVDALLGDDTDAAGRFVTELRHDGLNCDILCHDLLAPAARRLRAIWRDDLCDYASFRLGIWRLRRMLHMVDHNAVARRAAHRDPAAALLLCHSAGQPDFEHDLAVQCFHRAGWQVQNGVADGSLHDMLRSQQIHVVLLSMGETARQDGVVAAIRAIRRASRNRAIGVVCAGTLTDPLPEAWEFGADAVVADARGALAFAERWREWQAESEMA